MASNARVFRGCRVLFEAAKAATPKSTATKKIVTPKSTATKKIVTPKSTATKKIVTPKSTATGFAKPENKNSGILKMTPVSPALGSFLGVPEIARTEAVKKIWEYIKLHNLQNPTNKREILCDHKLKTIFEGKEKVGFLEIGKLLVPHFVKTT